MKQVSGREFAKIIEKHGWVLKRVKCSHHIYGKHGRIERISVPIHGNKPLKLGLLKSHMKIVPVEESDL